MIRAMCILLLCQLAGEMLVRLTAIPVPGPVAGMVLLLGAFVWRGGAPDDLRVVSRGLLLNLSLLFVPAGVGIMIHLDRVRLEWPILAGALFITTLVTALVTVGVFRLVQRWTDGRDREAQS